MIDHNLFENIKKQLITTMNHQLPDHLYYHGVPHTLDVLEQVQRIAGEERVRNDDDITLLKIAALYHDSGFLHTYEGHEETSCNIARGDLQQYLSDPDDIDKVCRMIMATKIPQTPHTHLEKIICDADLDYLGREDFFEISDSLYRELKARGIIENKNEWNKVQVSFFKQHHYFTQTNQLSRAPSKSRHLSQIESSLT